MTVQLSVMSEPEAARAAAPLADAGLGALRTGRGNLPLDRIDVAAEIVGLVSQVRLTQEFVNVHDEPLEATYVFPLPDRSAVTGMRMTAADRVIDATLRERGEAREAYDAAIAAGQRAAIAEEERPDVFTMRVGNIVPGERVTVTLTLAGALAVEDGEATFRFPLVVAPRYIPGTPLTDGRVGDGYADDTDAVPDASRITPPVLLPGFPNPVRLTIEVGVDPAGLPLGTARSSLHAVTTDGGRIRIRPGERADRDFVLRLPYGAADDAATTLTLVPDTDGDEGTYELVVLPPEGGAGARPRPRDVVLLLDRSGSMGGWKMVAARRAAARIVDTLTDDDRFAVLAFDHLVESPDGLPEGLVAATDRHRYRAVEHLARMDARGGTELLDPLRRALALLTDDSRSGDGARDRVVVLVTDGQVGDEDRILAEAGDRLGRVRVHTVGVDQAVNAGFLGRLASVGGGRCELVESEDRLDEAMSAIHRRIGSPLVTGVSLTATGLDLLDGTRTPDRLPDLFPGVPYLVRGRYRASTPGASTPGAVAPGAVLALSGTTREGRPWSRRAVAAERAAPSLPAIWARSALRDLEDRYAALGYTADERARPALESRIVATSLRFGVLCRFTAYVAVDTRTVTDGAEPRRIIQPVEQPAGWEMAGATGAVMPMAATMSLPAAMPAPGGPPMAGAAPAPSAGYAPPPAAGAARRLAGALGGTFPGGPTLGRPAVGREADPGTELREWAAREARRLRDAADEPAYRRRELLEDLGSRLVAVIGGGPFGRRPSGGPRLADAGAGAGTAADALRGLAERLAPERLPTLAAGGSALDELWREALRILDAVASGPVAPPPGGTGSRPPRTRRAFWKR